MCLLLTFLSKNLQKSIISRSKKELEQARDVTVAHPLAVLGQRIPVIVHEGQVVLSDTVKSGQIWVKVGYITLGLHEHESGFLPGRRSESSIHSI